MLFHRQLYEVILVLSLLTLLVTLRQYSAAQENRAPLVVVQVGRIVRPRTLHGATQQASQHQRVLVEHVAPMNCIARPTPQCKQ